MNPLESPDDRLIRELLARETPAPPPSDAEFTQRVLAALPPHPRRDWRNIVAVATGVAVGLGWVAWNGGHISNLVDMATDVADRVGDSPLLAFGIAVGVFVLLGADSAYAPPVRRSAAPSVR